VIPGVNIKSTDISEYVTENVKEEVKENHHAGNAEGLVLMRFSESVQNSVSG